MKTLLLSSCVALCASILSADTFVWTGAEDAYWTNAANWQVEVAGGGGEWETASRCPGSVLMDDATAQWDAFDLEADTAVFDETGALPTAGYIDLDGHLSIKFLVFRGATAPAYVFGKTASSPTAAGSQRIGLRTGGSLTFESTLGTAPVFRNGITPHQGTSQGSATFVNNSSVICDLGPIQGCQKARTKTDPAWPGLTFSGTGSFIVGDLASNCNGVGCTYFTALTLNQGGTFKFAGSYGNLKTLTFNPPAGVTHDIEIAAGKTVGITYLWTSDIIANGNVRIHGGTLALMGQGNKSDINTKFDIATGKWLELSTGLKGNGLDTLYLQRRSSTNTGTLRFTADTASAFTGDLMHQSVMSLECSALGNSGAASPLGKSANVRLGGNVSFVYTGAGETCDRTFTVGDYATAATSATLVQRGTGALAVAGILGTTRTDKADAVDTIVLDNGTAFDATVSGPITDGASDKVAVKKTGSGTWTLAGANTYTGATTLEGGTLAYATSQTIPSLVVNGDAALAIADGVTVTVSALSRTTGSLDVQTTGTGKLIVNGAAFGSAEAWMTINGKPANVQADGTITAADHTWTSNLNIPAHGGVIPTTATDADVVGITTDGTGDDPITLEAEAGATIKGLVQKTAADATVSLANGQTLTTGLIAIEPTAGSLTIATNETGGAFAISGSKLTLDVGNADETLTIDAPFVKTDKTLAKTGAGTAALSLAANEVAYGTVADGTMTFAAGETALTLEKGAGDFTGYTLTADAEGDEITVKGDKTAPAPLVLSGTTATGHQIKITPKDARIDICGEGTRLATGEIDLRTIASDVAATSTLYITDGAYVEQQGDAMITLGGLSSTQSAQTYKKAYCELVVSNAVLTRASPATGGWDKSDKCLLVGNCWGSGIVRLEEGGVITNRLRIGGWDWYGQPERGLGAFYQYGGTSYWTGGCTVGSSGEGYMEVNGGEAFFASGFYLSTTSVNAGDCAGEGVLAVNGGSFRVRSLDSRGINQATAHFGDSDITKYASKTTNRWAVAYFKGGEVELPVSPYLGQNQCRTVVNFAGANVSCYSPMIRNSSTGVYLNLLDGVFHFNSLPAKNSATCLSYLNLNGGTILFGGGYQATLSVGPACFNRTTVYEKGFTLKHVNWFGNARLYGPFRAAPGKGLASVELTDAIKQAKFYGSPVIDIQGDGEGATAYAEFDSRKGVVTNVVITSPGWNYTWAKARIVRLGTTIYSDIPCTLKDNVRGPFVFDGSIYPGQSRLLDMTIIGTNEFGSVVVKAGTLRASNRNSIPEDADIVMKGGTLDMGTNALVFASLSGTGGILQGVTNAVGKLAVTTANPGTGLGGVTFKNADASKTVALAQTCNGAWTVDAADLVAGKKVSVPGELAFGNAATLTITGGVALLDPSVKYTVLTATAGSFAGMPTLTNADLKGWKIKKVGGDLRLYKPEGLMLIVW